MKSFRAPAASAVTHTVRGAYMGAARPGAARPSGPVLQAVPTGTAGDDGDSGWGCSAD